MDTSGLDLRFRLGSTPVTVTPLFWLSGLFIVMQQRLSGPQLVLWLLLYFVSILVHEMGHALVSQAYGSHAAVTLHSFGGEARHRPLSRWRSVAVSLAGPGAGFVLGAIAFGVLRGTGLSTFTLGGWALLQLVIMNFFWGFMNLLPVLPLDGGNVLMGALGRRHERTVHIVGVVVAGLVVLWAVTAGQIFIALMFGMLAFQNIQTLRALGGR